MSVCAITCACLSAGCGGGGAAAVGPAGLQHEDPGVRLRAIRQAGEAHDASAAPFLIDRLSDSDGEVRFFAIIALEKITGLRMDFEPYHPLPRRQRAIERWRQWLSEQSPAAAGAGAKEGGAI